MLPRAWHTVQGQGAYIKSAANHRGCDNPTPHLAVSVMMPSEHLVFPARDTFSHLLIHLRPLFRSHGTSPHGGAQHERCNVPSATVVSPDQSQSLPLEIDLPLMTDLSTLPEHLVDAVQNLKPFLPVGCDLLGQGDLKIVGSRPIDAGGFADIWLGKTNDGATVAIKSHRCYSSSSSLPMYLVSGGCTARSSVY